MSQSTKITIEQALQFFEVYLIDMIRTTDALEPNARAVGRMEAFKDSLIALNNLMNRCQIKSDPNGRADRSHVEALAEYAP